ncbi:hypothetical protein V6B95_08985 [Thermoanaerobacterium saccharolyticum]
MKVAWEIHNIPFKDVAMRLYQTSRLTKGAINLIIWKRGQAK